MLVVNSARLPPPLLYQLFAKMISSLWSVCCSLTVVWMALAGLADKNAK
jgi:hypothetical protein